MSTTTSDFLRHLRELAARQTLGGLSDQQLLERFRLERSEASFALLVQRHGPMVLNVCRRVLHHAQDAEDAFQAAFLVLAKKAATLHQPQLLSSWLHGVAYHIALRLKAKAQRRTAHEQRIDPPPPGDAMDDITWRELRSVLDEELQRLPEKYRAPLVLCYLEARTQDEAARRLGWSKNTFGRRINQARQMLARRLTHRGLTLPAALTAPLLIDSTATAALPLLAASTVRAGLAAAMGQATGTLVSAQAAALAESSVASLLVKKASIAVVLLVSLMLGVGGLLAHRAVQDRTFAEASVTPPAPIAQSPPARSASKGTVIEIKGRVLDPDGKPLAGAHLFLLSEVTRKKANVFPYATTDKEGRFHFTVSPADFGPQGKGVLAATATGFGIDWIDISAKDKGDEITLWLVADDKPVVGRVLDLEGKPIAGLTVQVRSVRKQADGGDLASWVERNVKVKGILNAELDKMTLLLPTGLDVSATAKSEADGRFRLIGFGRERVLHLAIRGPTTADANFYAVTRTVPTKGWISGEYGLYGARFDYVIGPCKPVIGTIRDKRTGKPLAGITVAAVDRTRWCQTKTDDQGRYRIVGLAKSKEYDVAAGGMPYVNCPKNDIADTPGLEPLTVNFELDRGIAMKGRLIDKTTGKPVSGHVYYRPMPDNPHLKDFADLNKGGAISPYDPGDTAADGSFTVVAIPGPGWLGARANTVNRFARIEGGPGDQSHAAIRINPSENDPKSTTCEIALEPADVLKGSVIGPDGKPLAGVYAAGRWPVVHFDLLSHEKLETDSFQVGGMKAGHLRTLVFLHPEKKLGKVVKLQGDEKKPLVVRLGPLDAALTGRILDAKGRPWPGLKVSARTLLGGDVFRDKSYPPEFIWRHFTAWQNLEVHNTKTDGDGRFRIASLMPGLKYRLFAREEKPPPETLYAYDDDDLIVTIDAGKTKDLGDLKCKGTSDKQ